MKKTIQDFERLINVKSYQLKPGCNFYYNGEDGVVEYIFEKYVNDKNGYARIICDDKKGNRKEIIIHTSFDNHIYVDKLSKIKDREY